MHLCVLIRELNISMSGKLAKASTETDGAFRRGRDSVHEKRPYECPLPVVFHDFVNLIYRKAEPVLTIAGPK